MVGQHGTSGGNPFSPTIHQPLSRTFCWLAKPYGLANYKLCYIQRLLNIEKSGEQDQERS